VVDAEWSILYNKLDRIHQSGAKVVLSKLPIGDVATQFFADRFIWCFSLNYITFYWLDCLPSLLRLTISLPVLLIECAPCGLRGRK